MPWFKIRSWHLATQVSRAGIPIKARCGLEPRPGPVETSDGMPLDEPSCETCLRLSRHDQGG